MSHVDQICACASHPACLSIAPPFDFAGNFVPPSLSRAETQTCQRCGAATAPRRRARAGLASCLAARTGSMGASRAPPCAARGGSKAPTTACCRARASGRRPAGRAPWWARRASHLRYRWGAGALASALRSHLSGCPTCGDGATAPWESTAMGCRCRPASADAGGILANRVPRSRASRFSALPRKGGQGPAVCGREGHAKGIHLGIVPRAHSRHISVKLRAPSPARSVVPAGGGRDVRRPWVRVPCRMAAWSPLPAPCSVFKSARGSRRGRCVSVSLAPVRCNTLKRSARGRPDASPITIVAHMEAKASSYPQRDAVY